MPSRGVALAGTALAATLAAWCRRGAHGNGIRGTASSKRNRVSVGAFRRDLSLDGYPVHGPGFYWTLSKCTSAVLIYVPIADDVETKDVVFDCHDGHLVLGLTPEKGGIVIDDDLLYKVDVEESYFQLEEGEYGERCIALWLEKLTRNQLWYAYDRFDPVTERFLLKGEKERARLDRTVTHLTYLDVEVDGASAGRIVLGLYGNMVPKTVENFRCLCTGEKGKSEETGEPLHYKSTRLHRLIPGFCVQGGQTWETPDEDGGESIYGLTFEDECLRMKFNEPWLLAMANGGPDTNGSQFFITTSEANHLSYKTVAFGEVVDGKDVVLALERLGDDDGSPTKEVVVVDCGELAVGEASVDEEHVDEESATVPS